jgi:acyl carrier protein
MIDVEKLLLEITEDERVKDKNIDLIESGVIDSYVFIELLSRLEDEGITIYPTRIDRNKLRTIKGIEELIKKETT